MENIINAPVIDNMIKLSISDNNYQLVINAIQKILDSNLPEKAYRYVRFSKNYFRIQK